MAKAPAAIQTASLAGSDMSSWQSQPTRAEVAQPGTISPQALTNAHRFGVGFQYVGLAEGMAYDHELDPELFNAAPSLS